MALVARGAAKGALAVLALGFEGFAIVVLGDKAEGFLFRLEVGGVEDVVVFVVLGRGIAGRLLSLARAEGLGHADEALAAARVGGGELDLLRRQQLGAAGFEVAAPERADAHAHQLADAQTEAGEHLAHLALEPLFQHHAGATGREARDKLGLGLALGDAHTFEQLDEHTVIEGLVERDPVLLLDAAAGVADALAERAVVGEDEQALAVGIEAAHVVGVAVLGRQQVVDGAYCTLRLAAADVATRLVEQQHNFFLRGGSVAVHLHKVGGQNAQAGRVDGLAIHFDTAFGNEAVGGAAGFIAAGSEELVEAHAALRRGGV